MVDILYRRSEKRSFQQVNNMGGIPVTGIRVKTCRAARKYMLHGILNYSMDPLWTDPLLFLIDRNDTSVGKVDDSRAAADGKRKTAAHDSIIYLGEFIHLDKIRVVLSIIIDITFSICICDEKAIAFEKAGRISDEPDTEARFF